MRRQCGSICCPAVTSLFELAFVRLYESGIDDAMIALCGFDHTTFDILLDMFEPMFELHSPYSESRLVTQNFDCSWGGYK